MTIKVDLLPTKEKKFGIDPVMIFLVLVIIICTVGFFVWGKQLENSIASKEKEVQKMDVVLQDLKAKLPNIDKLRNDNAKLEQQINTIKGLKNDPVRYANLLSEIGEVLPANCWLNNISIEPATKSVIIAGTSVDTAGIRPLDGIARLIKTLPNSRYFSDATLTSVGLASQGKGLPGWSFNIETHYDENAALKPPSEVAPKGAPAASASPGAAASPAPGAPAAPGNASTPGGSAPASPSAASSPAAGAPSGSPAAAPAASAAPAEKGR